MRTAAVRIASVSLDFLSVRLVMLAHIYVRKRRVPGLAASLSGSTDGLAGVPALAPK
jgi:hypothetical protein